MIGRLVAAAAIAFVVAAPAASAHGVKHQTGAGRQDAPVAVAPPPEAVGKTTLEKGDLGALPGFGGPFDLVDQHGVRRSDKDFRGRFMLVMFGFTECVDICPVELSAISQAMDLLGNDGEHLTPIFITVDPQVDTPARLKEFLANFHPAIVGLTGAAEQLNATLKAYRAQVARLNDRSDRTTGKNKFGHTSFLYLMGPDGGFRSLFLVNPSAEEIAGRVRKYLAAS